MRGGDLSNEVAPAMGIRFERVVKTEEGRLNKALKGYLQSLSRSVDVNVYIISTTERRKALSFLLKWAVPYNEVIHADSLIEIPDIVREHNMLTYYDLDRNVVQNVNSRGSGKIDAKLWTLVQVS